MRKPDKKRNKIILLIRFVDILGKIREKVLHFLLYVYLDVNKLRNNYKQITKRLAISPPGNYNTTIGQKPI